jgi:hypothetical protein
MAKPVTERSMTPLVVNTAQQLYAAAGVCMFYQSISWQSSRDVQLLDAINLAVQLPLK